MWLPAAVLAAASAGAVLWVSRQHYPVRRVRSGSVALLSGRAADLAPGRLLVARRDLGDPNFERTVVVLLRHDGRSSMGLVINRRTRVVLSELFPKHKSTARTSDPIFWGGPVGMTGALALLRAEREAEAEEVMPGVHLITSKDVLEKKLAESGGVSRLRVYLGYCGWGPGQLQQELELGAWHLMQGDSSLVFDPAPETLWSRLIARTELQIVRILCQPRSTLEG